MWRPTSPFRSWFPLVPIRRRSGLSIWRSSVATPSHKSPSLTRTTNPRAQQQQGLFLKVKDVVPVENLIGDYLEHHDIPTGSGEQSAVLSALNDMMITARHLFRDLDGAARTAAINVLVFGEG